MADAPRIDVDGFIVVHRRELDAAVDTVTKGTDALGWRQGFVFGMSTVAVLAAFGGMAGLDPFSAEELVFSLMCGVAAAAMVWRIWDASAATFRLGYWEVAGFAAAMKTQWESEVNGGRADG